MIIPEPIDDSNNDDGVIVAGPNNVPFPSKLYNMLEHVHVWHPLGGNVDGGNAEVDSRDSSTNQAGDAEQFIEKMSGRRQTNFWGSQR